MKAAITILLFGVFLLLFAEFANGQSHGVALACNAEAGVTFNFYRSTAQGKEIPSTPIASNLAACAFTDANVVGGLEYWYVVTATGGNGVESGPSNEVFAQIPVPNPTGLKATYNP